MFVIPVILKRARYLRRTRRGHVQFVSDVCSLWIPSRHIDGFIRWRVGRVGAEGRAGLRQ
jgi:hypothetical protein